MERLSPRQTSSLGLIQEESFTKRNAKAGALSPQQTLKSAPGFPQGYPLLWKRCAGKFPFDPQRLRSEVSKTPTCISIAKRKINFSETRFVKACQNHGFSPRPRNSSGIIWRKQFLTN
jgi:hypothetical protein